MWAWRNVLLPMPHHKSSGRGDGGLHTPFSKNLEHNCHLSGLSLDHASIGQRDQVSHFSTKSRERFRWRGDD